MALKHALEVPRVAVPDAHGLIMTAANDPPGGRRDTPHRARMTFQDMLDRARVQVSNSDSAVCPSADHEGCAAVDRDA